MRSQSFKLSAFILLGLLPALSLPAQTSQDPADTILQNALKQAALQPLGKYINQTINDAIFINVHNWISSTPVNSNTPNEAGTVGFALYSFGQAAYDFTQAQTDKQRFYTGAQAGVAVISVFGTPAAGAIAQGILTAAQISEALVNSGIQEEIMNLQTQILKDQTVILNVQKSFAASDIAAMQVTVAMYLKAGEDLAQIEQQIGDQNCASVDQLNTKEKFESCSVLLMSQISGMGTKIRLLQELLFSKTQIVLITQQVLHDQNVDVGHYVQVLQDLNTKVEIQQSQTNALLTAYSTEMYTSILKESEKAGYLSVAEDFFDSCENTTLNFIRTAALIQQFGDKAPASLKQVLTNLNRSSFTKSYKQFIATQPCRQSADSTNRLYPNLIENLNTLDKLEKLVAKNEFKK